MTRTRSVVRGACLLSALVVAHAGCGGRQRLPLPRTSGSLVATSEEAFRDPPDPLPATRSPIIPEVEETTLPNGMRVLFVRRAGLPLVSVRFVCRASGHEDQGLLRGDDELLEKVLEDLGHDTAPQLMGAARPTADVTASGVWIDADGASEQLGVLIDTIARLARAPRITDERVRTARRPLAEDILLAANGIASVTAVHEGLLVYGEHDPRARPWFGDLASFRRISALDLVGRHAALFTPSESALVVVGDTDFEAVRSLATSAFADWSAPVLPSTPLATPTFPIPHARLHAIPTGGDESTLRLRERAPPREHADRPAFEVLTSLLGGMFGARVNRVLREERGHTYGIQATIADHRDYALLQIDLAVPSSHIRSTVFMLVDEMRRMQDASGIEADELSRARATALALYRQRFSTRAATATTLGSLFIRGTALDALLSRAMRVNEVTAEDVARVARAWIRPEAAPIIVIGTYRDLQGSIYMIPGGSEFVVWRW
jgi:zinc protease